MKYDIRHRNQLGHPLYGYKKIHMLHRTKSYLGDPKPLFAHYTTELRVDFTKLQLSQTKTYDEVSNQRLPLTPTATWPLDHTLLPRGAACFEIAERQKRSGEHTHGLVFGESVSGLSPRYAEAHSFIPLNKWESAVSILRAGQIRRHL